MRAVILAAGVGRRMQPFTQEHPKCLLPFGNRTLLEYHLEHLAEVGASQVSIVVGHLQDQIAAIVSKCRLDLTIELLPNPRYEDGSAISLLTAAACLQSGDCLLMDADVLCGPAIFRRLLSSPAPDCALVDGRLSDTGEEVKVVVDPGGRVVELGKQIQGRGRVAGESVGIFRLSTRTGALLAERLAEGTLLNPKLEYEPVINDLLAEVDFRYAPVDDLDWIEIDFAADAEKARNEVYPRLAAREGLNGRRPGPAVLFTPGPLTTSATVKAAMLRDVGSRDDEFISLVQGLRRDLVRLAGGVEGFEAVLLQGSGTFGIEAVLSSLTPVDGRWLFLINGAYGRRMRQIADILGIDSVSLEVSEDQPILPGQVEAELARDSKVTHVGLVHCETTTGILNAVADIGAVVARMGRRFMVDAMSSFGGIPLSVSSSRIDCLVASANKCLEGVPGLSFVVVRRDMLEAGHPRSLSLDLVGQWRGLEANGQFRFTPPTHAILALARALRELEDEGGVQARSARYRSNHETLATGMRKLGFQAYLSPEHQSWIITSYLYPEDPRFDFSRFYGGLQRRGFIIYPGKLSQANCFRIGTIGRIRPADVQALLAAVGETLDDLYISSGENSGHE